MTAAEREALARRVRALAWDQAALYNDLLSMDAREYRWDKAGRPGGYATNPRSEAFRKLGRVTYDVERLAADVEELALPAARRRRRAP